MADTGAPTGAAVKAAGAGGSGAGSGAGGSAAGESRRGDTAVRLPVDVPGPTEPLSPPPTHSGATKLRLKLTPREVQIFTALKQVVQHAGLNTTLRVAGGWVRDKLLHKTSHDIDIALDNMMGAQFAQHVQAWQRENGKAASGVAVIAANPEQSKHLETATLKLYGLDIDLVNLRCEEYTEASRIPTSTRIGTPYEDAMRRDFTVNSLFYNVTRGVVEDFVGKGVDDLRLGVIRTPLHPVTTLLDDPLRALRAIRFASKLRFRVADDLAAGLGTREVHEALAAKVSRERVGTEVNKALGGPHPLRAMQLLYRFGLEGVVFASPDRMVEPAAGGVDLPRSGLPTIETMFSLEPVLHPLLTADASHSGAGTGAGAGAGAGAAASASAGAAPVATSGGDGTDAAVTATGSDGEEDVVSPDIADVDGQTAPSVAAAFDSDSLRLMSLAAGLLPVAGRMYEGKKRRQFPVVQHVIAESIRLGNKDTRSVLSIHAGVLGILPLLGAPDRLATGLLLAHVKHLWPVALHIAHAFRVASVTGVASGDAAGAAVAVAREQVAEFVRNVYEWKLERIWERERLLDGNDMKNMGAMGRTIGSLVDAQLRWQIMHENGTKEECTEALRVVLAELQAQQASKKKGKAKK